MKASLVGAKRQSAFGACKALRACKAAELRSKALRVERRCAARCWESKEGVATLIILSNSFQCFKDWKELEWKFMGILSPLCYVIEPTGRFRNEMEKESGRAERRALHPVCRDGLYCPSARHMTACGRGLNPVPPSRMRDSLPLVGPQPHRWLLWRPQSPTMGKGSLREKFIKNLIQNHSKWQL